MTDRYLIRKRIGDCLDQLMQDLDELRETIDDLKITYEKMNEELKEEEE